MWGDDFFSLKKIKNTETIIREEIKKPAMIIQTRNISIMRLANRAFFSSGR